MAVDTPICNFGWKAVDFSLEGIDGRTYSLADVAGPKGTLVIFICNHCPYVKSIIGRIVRDVADLKAKGIGTVAIMANDTESYPEDSFENMKVFGREHAFNFPYVIDRSQQVARAYDAVCTPSLGDRSPAEAGAPLLTRLASVDRVRRHRCSWDQEWVSADRAASGPPSSR